ncbi:MAG: M20/M25/M40 family metallo-hydrolase [Caldilineaceae bacterium]
MSNRSYSVSTISTIAWVQELTRIPSVWRPERGEGEEAAARWVEERCRAMGLETHFEFVEPGRPNVIALHRMGDGPTLMFEGHTDVVTEGDLAAWSDPPFSATIRDGRIYGRGANDMKAGVVCALLATKAIVESGVNLNGTILLGMVCDEEGRMIGIKDFVVLVGPIRSMLQSSVSRKKTTCAPVKKG